MSRALVVVRVYFKKDCPLCDELQETLDHVRKREAFDFEKVDITDDPELMKRHGEEVPVVLINGRKAFKGHAPEAELVKKIDKARSLANKTRVDPQSEDFVPPRPIAALVLVAAIAAVAYFVDLGFERVSQGRRILAGQLLGIEERDIPPLPFDLESIEGQKVSLESLRGKVVFLNFWATWCPPCVEEMPSLTHLGETLSKHDDFALLLVSADADWTPVKKFFEGDKPSGLVLLDQDGAIAGQYGTTMFPETYVIVDGRVRAFIEGPRDWNTWYARAFIESFLPGA